MKKDEKVKIQYASKYAQKANYWKYYIGQTKGLKRLKVYDKKVALENQFTEWMDGNQQNKDKYADALPLIKDAYEGISKYELARIYQSEAIMRGSEIIGLASRFSNLKKELEADEVNQENVDKQVQRMKDMLPDYFKDYNLPTDKKLLAAMMKMYYENVPADQQPAYIKEIHKKFKGNFDAYADMVFEKSVFTTSDKVMAFLDDPSAKKLDKDPAYMAAKEFNNFYFENIRPETMDYYDKLDKGNRLFIAGLREMQPNKKFYPDANFTMRLTYGQVLDYYPADAVHYNYFTTMKGIMEKEDPNNWEFVVPEKLKQLYKAKDFGRYGEGEVMKVCFLTNHDITGGNSGSPVMNANGELIGLAFDGNWEAMSGDIVFEPEIQRTINVDIRYVLFIIDKYAGCTRLINEMDIVSKRMKPAKELIEQTEEEPVEAER